MGGDLSTGVGAGLRSHLRVPSKAFLGPFLGVFLALSAAVSASSLYGPSAALPAVFHPAWLWVLQPGSVSMGVDAERLPLSISSTGLVLVPTSAQNYLLWALGP